MGDKDVTLITFVHWRDFWRLAAEGELARRIRSHKHPFYEVIVVRQRLEDNPEAAKIDYCQLGATREVRSEDFPTILEDFHINPNNAKADEMTHGETAPHYWKWHVINHLIGLKAATTPYIVFSDSDCRMESQPEYKPNWIECGISVLQNHRDVLIVSPSDGGRMAERRLAGGWRLTQNVSQQVFLCERERMLGVDFDVPWNWEFIAPGGPMQEYYYMLEGRLWRYMHKHNLWRAIIYKDWRYWHDQW